MSVGVILGKIENILKNESIEDIGLKKLLEYNLSNLNELIRNTNNVNKNVWENEYGEFFDFVIHKFPDYLENISVEISDNFKVDNCQTNAQINVLPWYSFSFEGYDDFKIYYLFNYDFSELYLTLDLKIGGKNIDFKETSEIFKKLIYYYYDKSENDLKFNILDKEISMNLKVQELYNELKSKSNRNENEKREFERLKRQLDNAENYENGNIFAKKYDKGNLPSDEILKKDLLEFLKLYEFIIEKDIFSQINNFSHKDFKDHYKFKHNLIYFGAPGTGKSFQLNEDKKRLAGNIDSFERVTFHPDYSYANFVGTYKPVSVNEDIKYKYVPGPFIRILEKAIQEENQDKDFLLIIEEINRANVAAVFGDMFQLLDRDESGDSRYEIDASEELKEYLGESKIQIPSNMYIWATMNSADQGVFPMDTAFKRRWDFNYLDINNNQKKIDKLKFTLNNKDYYSWNELRKSINKKLLKIGINEDKLIGPFFAFNEYIGKNEIPTYAFEETFKDKIIMYLFEDVLKSRTNNLFSGIDDKNLTFGKIREEFNKRGLDIFCESIKECPDIKVSDSSEETNED